MLFEIKNVLLIIVCLQLGILGIAVAKIYDNQKTIKQKMVISGNNKIKKKDKFIILLKAIGCLVVVGGIIVVINGEDDAALSIFERTIFGFQIIVFIVFVGSLIFSFAKILENGHLIENSQ